MYQVIKKCLTGQRYIRKEVISYKIHTLAENLCHLLTFMPCFLST